MARPRGSLIKSKAQLPPWFTLAAYEEKFTPHDWLNALVWRLVAKDVFANTGDKKKATELLESAVSAKPGATSSSLLDIKVHAGQLWGIRELPAFYAAYISTMIDATKTGRSLVARLKKFRKTRDSDSLFRSDEFEQVRKDTFATLVDYGTEPYRMPDVMPCFPVIVDLDQDDESLIAAFEVWLAGARDQLELDAPKPVADVDFASWQKYGLLPVFDLQLWAKLCGIRYSDSLVANSVWPDAEFDSTERLRKVTRPKIESTLRWEFVNRFWKQLEMADALDRLVQENRNAKS